MVKYNITTKSEKEAAYRSLVSPGLMDELEEKINNIIIIQKKFKDKKFAAGCSRYVIRQGAEDLGWELDHLLNETLEAMKWLEENK